MKRLRSYCTNIVPLKNDDRVNASKDSKVKVEPKSDLIRRLAGTKPAFCQPWSDGLWLTNSHKWHQPHGTWQGTGQESKRENISKVICGRGKSRMSVPYELMWESPHVKWPNELAILTSSPIAEITFHKDFLFFLKRAMTLAWYSHTSRISSKTQSFPLSLQTIYRPIIVKISEHSGNGSLKVSLMRLHRRSGDRDPCVRRQ